MLLAGEVYRCDWAQVLLVLGRSPRRDAGDRSLAEGTRLPAPGISRYGINGELLDMVCPGGTLFAIATTPLTVSNSPITCPFLSAMPFLLSFPPENDFSVGNVRGGRPPRLVILPCGPKSTSRNAGEHWPGSPGPGRMFSWPENDPSPRRASNPAHGEFPFARSASSREIAERFHPEKIILFGSHAYGTPHADSDVDLLVIMPARNMIDQAVRIRMRNRASVPAGPDRADPRVCAEAN